MEKTWHKKAILLYFGEHIKIIDIAERLGVTRQTVSVFCKAFRNGSKRRNTEKTKAKNAEKHKSNAGNNITECRLI